MHQPFQHLLLQGVEAGVTKKQTDATDAFREDRMVADNLTGHRGWRQGADFSILRGRTCHARASVLGR